tara:strand:- start:283 stop:480 length:198 start_codon:yes stop_codon:yes gene_type:complete
MNITEAQTNLIEKIKSLGQINHRNLSVDELIDAMKLTDLGIVAFKTTRRENKSRRFIVIKEGGEG